MVTKDFLFRPSRWKPRRAARLRLSCQVVGKLIVSFTVVPTKNPAHASRMWATRLLSFHLSGGRKTWTRDSSGVMAVDERKPRSVRSSRTASHKVRVVSGLTSAPTLSRKNSAILGALEVRRVLMVILFALPPQTLDMPVDGKEAGDDG